MKKTIKKTVPKGLVALIITLVYLCCPMMLVVTAQEGQEATFAFEQERTTLAVGQQTKLPLSVSSCYEQKKIIYYSSKPDVLSVDEQGIVTALQKGIATITAKINKQVYARCIIQAVVPVTAVQMNKQVITLNQGQTFRLKAQVLPEDASNKHIQWSSQSTKVATVENGLVTACGKGMTLVAAETKDGVKGYCVVLVKVPVQSVTVDSTSLSLTKGETRTIQAKVLPTNADNKKLTWKSTHPDIVTVDDSGSVTAVSAGKATIKAIAHNGQRALVTVQVYEPISAVSLPSSVTVGLGERHALTAVISPKQVSDKTLTWSSSNSKVATVVNGMVYAQSVGRTTITVRTVNGKSASCTVVVKNAPASVQLLPTSLTVGVGENYSLKTVLPDNTASHAILYTADDPTVCTVDQKGQITGKRSGSTTITVKLYNGRTAAAKVTVKPAPVSMTLNTNQLTLNLGDTTRLYSYIDAAHASYQRIYSSDNPSVAAVDANGNITAKAVGSAVITVSTFNNIQAYCRITVKTLPSYVRFAESSVLIFEGDTTSLDVLLPDNSSHTGLTYTTEDPSVCTVSSNGTIKGMKAGQTVITVTTVNGKKDFCTVTVKKQPSVLRLYVKKKTLSPKQTFQLFYYLGEDEWTTNITYTSSNTAICRVNDKGVVTAVNNGTTFVTMTTHNGKKAVCQITVTDKAVTTRPLYQRLVAVGQYPELPTGCEITALTAVLNFYGYPVDKCTLVDDYLDKGFAWETDFHEMFAGDPYSEYSYGCYAPVIVKAANRYLQEHASPLRATECTGLSLNDLFHFTDDGTPVIIWTTIDLVPGHYTDTWTATNGKTVTWYTNEHCMVLLGHTDEVVYAADPTYGTIVTYDKALFNQRYEELFRQAVVIN